MDYFLGWSLLTSLSTNNSEGRFLLCPMYNIGKIMTNLNSAEHLDLINARVHKILL